MATSLGGVLSYLRRLAPDGPAGAAEDGQLLSRFAGGDGSAFTALVGRYAPLVWGVCRRLLGPSPDAEDAFQATFVVLAQKANALADGRALGPWLHKVASRTATKARVKFLRRQTRETPAEVEPAVRDDPELDRREVGVLLEEEVSRLPERYRRPVVLCYLEGLTNEEAARRLACPKGTVLSRLSRAREQLRQRLARRGLDLASGALPAALASEPAPEALVAAVGQAGPLLRAGGAAGLSTSVLILAKGVMFSMFLRKLEVAGLVLLVMALAASGAGWLTRRPATAAAHAAPPAPPAGKGEDKAPPAAAKAEEKDKPAKPTRTEADVREALAKTIDFNGFEDPKTTLIEALDQLAKQYGVRFDVDERAFKAELLNDVLKTAIVETNPIPPMKAPLRVVLNKILARVNVPSGANFLVRKNFIEITTEAATLQRLGVRSLTPQDEAPAGGYRLLPLVFQHFRKEALDKALDELADASGFNVVLDARVEEKANVKVTARLMNVPVDTAVRLLADMAGLSVVRIDNVFYVTSPENARKMATEKPVAKSGERRGVTPAGSPAGM
jgi:RNA polymerase sigma factor (sigma-70 family)